MSFLSGGTAGEKSGATFYLRGTAGAISCASDCLRGTAGLTGGATFWTSGADEKKRGKDILFSGGIVC